MNEPLPSVSTPAMTIDSQIGQLPHLLDRPLGTVVHLGAGNGLVLARYAALAPARVVLVEGDPDMAAALQRSAAGLPWAQVLARPVAVQAGPLAWRRYNLPSLNGPLDAAPLQLYYPRLQQTGAHTLDAVALADVLADLGLAAEASAAHVLVVDVPGQEASLLAALPQELLACFDLLILRGCRDALPPGGAPVAQALDQLQQRSFDVLASASGSTPLWSTTQLRFNRQRFEHAQQQARLAALTAALAQRDQALAGAQQALDAQVAAARADADALQAAHAAQVQQLGQAADAQARLAAERQAQIEALAQAKAGADKLAAERHVQLAQATAAKLSAEKLAADRLAQMEPAVAARVAAEKLAADRQAQLEQAAKARDEQAKLAAERQAQVEALAQAKAAAEKLAADRLAQIEPAVAARVAAEKLAADRKTQLDQATKARDEQAKLAAERQAQVEALAEAKAAAEKLAAECLVQLE